MAGILYSKLKVFHFKEKLDSLPRKTDLILPPIHVRVKPTNVCNHNCWYCGYRVGSLQLGKDMVAKDFIPREKMFEIVDDFVEMGVKSITFSGGGEPFCYPYLLEVIKKLAETPVKFAAITNGSRLEGETAKVFARHGTWIRVSMDGWDSSSYASYRGVSKNEFNKVINNLKNFNKIGGACYLGVVIVIGKNNVSHVYEMIKLLKSTGVNSVKLSPCVVNNEGEKSNEYHRSYSEVVEEQIKRAVKKFKSKDFEIFNAYHDQLTTFNKNYAWCPYMQINPVIGADLNVYSCHDKAYNIKGGMICSIKKQRFRDAWSLNKSKFFKIKPSVHCKHHCVVNEKNKMILEYLDIDEGHLEFV